VVPIQLSVLYELPARVDPLQPQFLLPAVAVLIMAGVLLSLSRRWPAGLAVWTYYAIILAPVSGIVHAGHQLAHDRYSYLSCLGWALLLGAAVGSFARARASGSIRPSITRLAAALVAAWILALAAQTWYQVQAWRDTDTLWRYALESDSQCALCHANLGLSFYRRKLFPLAKEKYELALRLRPDRVRWNASLGLVAQGMGDFDEAIRYFSLARIYYPNDPDIIVNMAIALIEKKRYAEAITELNRAHRINPKHVPTLVTLGAAFTETGQPDKAVALLVRARDLSNDEPVIYLNLTRAYLALGEPHAARREYERLQRLDGHLAQSLTSEIVLTR
jgi:Tfp pilus assembly protein PilF